jgi:UDP-glucose 4-epimerase
MRIFVTGGAGYVGSACLRKLLAEGHDAIAFDNLCEGHREAVPDGRLIEGDIRDTQAVLQTLRRYRPDAVMHFAAATYVGESVENPDYHYANNIGGTQSLLRAMREAQIRRMLFSSTCATYGDNPEHLLNELSEQIPCSPYARTKLAVEWMIRDFAHAYGLGFTILRYFNAAGADPDGEYGENHDPENHLIPRVLEVPLGKHNKILLFGDDYPTPDGTCIRDYVHTDDLASAHLLAIAATTSRTAEVYNVGTGQGHSVKQIHAACERVTGRSIAFEIVGRRSGDAPVLVADSTKLKTRLGWKPAYVDIGAIVETAWRWHRRYPNGYADKAVRRPAHT